ncbi:polysaccharide lyase 6 family protein [Amycolatopsis keratiniphila]|uniref:Lyase n=1 Tax=Amycolatopsis keratiniphila subsp. keratiniphila TaxID=227715 RepID=A0A1W2M046_9PSEU|nr:polysaccharide lyase 6 family protein [Amycolatopsis keratiniphila]ONF73029.1 lyase precursor [Amycolatopsis keratiniphila subsp. keratiniphila]
MDRRRFLSGATLGAALITVPWVTAGTASAKPQGLCALNVSSLTELQTAINRAAPGAVITVENGTYAVPSGKPITVKGRRGTKDQPITIIAQSRGGVTFTGEQSFVFDDSTGVTLSGFEFRQSTTLEIPANCSRIRLTRNDFQLADLPDLDWVMVRADYSKVDRNHFHHKTTIGVMLCIEGADDDKMATGVHVVRNYFSDHSFAGDNGGEPIRLGVSPRALSTASATVEYNLFERANGDPEAISVKSSGNFIRHNTIRNSRGGIVLRHGNKSVVEANFILDGKDGIRIYGNDHKIVNNYIAGLSSRALVVGSGTVRDHFPGESKESRRKNDAADRVLIAHNTLLNNGGTLSGETNRTIEPRDCTISDNIFVGDNEDLVSMSTTGNFTWSGNILWGSGGNGNIPAGTFRRVDPKLVQGTDGISRLAAGSPAIDSATLSTAPVTLDIDGQARGSLRDVGADEYSTAAIANRPLTTADVGPGAP